MSEADGPVLAADGTPLKRSLARALRREKLRALLLIAPLLIFVMISFVAPIIDMLFRSVENQIVSQTLPRTVTALADWDGEALPDEDAFAAMAYDLVAAKARKEHTKLGTRLNYEQTGLSSLFRKTGRRIDDIGEAALDQFEALDPAWGEGATWLSLLGTPEWRAGYAPKATTAIDIDPQLAALLPETSASYREFVETIGARKDLTREEPWAPLHLALLRDLRANGAELAAYEGPEGARLKAAAAAVAGFAPVSARDAFIKADDDWGDPEVWRTLKTFSPEYTPGYFLASADLKQTSDGIASKPDDEQIYLKLFMRTFVMSLIITGACIFLGYPIAWLLANLPARTANLLLILVLLPFWTSLLVRTSAWKVLLQQQGVINDVLVSIGVVDDAARLIMINNQTGTIIAMTHILLPFMILPLYSVMKTIPPSYLRAAKSLGATNTTAFLRVYFPQSVPGIGAGSILVFILAIGYYITPELVGGPQGTFISNRIAYHISSSLNWGLAAALGTVLLVVVLVLYYAYDRIVGIDNVSLG